MVMVVGRGCGLAPRQPSQEMSPKVTGSTKHGKSGGAPLIKNQS